MQLTLDLETSGFIQKSLPLSHPDQCRIVQIGAILDYPDGTEAARLDVVVAVQSIPDKAAAIHGITTELSQKIGVNESTAIELLLDLIEVADVIVGQNIKGFDNPIITGAARRVVQNENFDPFAGKTIFDTMLAGQAVCRIPWSGGGWKKPNLTELHKHLFGEGFEGAHSAITDVLAARRCYYRLLQIMNIPAPEPRLVQSGTR